MVIIRDAVKEDFSAIVQLRLAAYAQYRHVMGEGWEPFQQSLMDMTEGANIDYIVAEWKGEVVGAVVLYPPYLQIYERLLTEGQEPEFRKLAVAEKARGQKIGRALVEECIKRSKARGFNGIGLHTSDFMENAVQLYTNLGFVRNPELDFPTFNGQSTVKAYRLSFE